MANGKVMIISKSNIFKSISGTSYRVGSVVKINSHFRSAVIPASVIRRKGGYRQAAAKSMPRMNQNDLLGKTSFTDCSQPPVPIQVELIRFLSSLDSFLSRIKVSDSLSSLS